MLARELGREKGCGIIARRQIDEVGAGHAARARIDTFLQNWLTMRCHEAIAAKHLYDRFVKRMDAERESNGQSGAKCDVTAVMSAIALASARFRTLVEPTGKTRFDSFLRRLSTMGLVVFHPFLLAVMEREESDHLVRDQIAKIVESYLVRRMICNAETRSYGALCLTLRMSSITRTWPSQAGDAPMPMVGIGDSAQIRRATGSAVASMTRGVAASDDRKRDAAQLRAPRPRLATTAQRQLRPSAAQRRCDGVGDHNRTINSWGLNDVPRGGPDGGGFAVQTRLRRMAGLRTLRTFAGGVANGSNRRGRSVIDPGCLPSAQCPQ